MEVGDRVIVSLSTLYLLPPVFSGAYAVAASA